MGKQSAGILLYRFEEDKTEVFLVHPGGPYWAKKDEHTWSIPKGEFGEEEPPMTAARREFQEETGFNAPENLTELSVIKQSGGKTVHAWAAEKNVDPADCQSNTFRMEWPPKSGKEQEFPEIDRAAWFSLENARQKILKSQIPLINELESLLRK